MASIELNELITRLRRCSTRTELLKCFNDAILCLKLNETKSATIFDTFQLGQAFLDITATSNLLSQLTKNEYRDHFLQFFCIILPPFVVLKLLSRNLSDLSIDSKRKSFFIEKLIDIGVNFVKNRRFDTAFKSMTEKTTSDQNESIFDEIIQNVVALPEKVANILRCKVPDYLQPEKYFKSVALAMLQSLNQCNDNLMRQKDCSLKFHSQLLGKIQLCGYGRNIIEILVPFFNRKCKPAENSMFIWRKLSQRLIVGMPRQAMESFMTDILTFAESICPKSIDIQSVKCLNLSNLIGDAVLNDEKLKLVLTKKLIFSKYFESCAVPMTICRYLAHSNKTRSLLIDLFIDVISMMSRDDSSFQRPLEQHFYWCQIIVICLHLFNESDLIILKPKMTSLMINFIQTHLKNPTDTIRLRGMVIGEMLSFFDTTKVDAAILKFEYDEKEAEVQILKNLMQRNKLDLCIEEKFTDLVDFDEITELDNLEGNNIEPTQGIICDSDDDLEPYPMPNATSLKSQNPTSSSKFKKPIYIRECLEGLQDDKIDFDQYSLYFFTTKELSETGTVDLEVTSFEVVRYFLHIENKYTLDQFDSCRLSIISSICGKFPQKIAPYLTQEFYAPNYTIVRRVEILDSLRMAAKILVQPDPIIDPDQIVKSNGPNTTIDLNDQEYIVNKEIQNARLLIESRLKEKTRYFTKSLTTALSTTKENKPKMNKFIPVAGLFFYPLMAKFDRPSDATLDLLTRDSFVLSRLLHTVGTFLQYAANGPQTFQMALRLLEFVFGLQHHNEAVVRRGVLFCLACIAISVPVITVLLDTVADDGGRKLREYLGNAMMNETDRETREMAKAVLALLSKKVNQELNMVEECETIRFN